MRLSLCSLLAALGCASASEPETIVYATVEGQPLHLDIHRPEDAAVEPLPIVLWIHGGGWQNGSRANWKMVDWLPSEGYAVVSIDYRLTGVAPFPAQIHDCRAALGWLKKHGADHGLETEHIVTAGLSAGAHLATLLAVTNDQNALPVRGAIHFYGPSDLVQIARYAKKPTDPLNTPGNNVHDLLGGPLIERLDLAREASPVTHLDESDPPLLIIVGTADTQMTQRHCARLATAAEAVGVRAIHHRIEGAGHGGSKLFWDAERRSLILDFLRPAE